MRSLEDIQKHYAKSQKDGKPSPLGSRPSLHKQESEEEVVIFGWQTGRTPARWGKIIGFYIVYYSFLACLTWVSIVGIAANSMPLEAPFLQNRLHSPGMKIFPASLTADTDYPDLVDEHEKNSKTNEGFGHVVATGTVDSNIVAAYKQAWDDFLAPYKAYNNWSTCNENSTQADTDAGKMCQHYVDYDWIENECGSNYGYDTGSPCFAFSLNRVLNWQPIAHEDSTTINMLNVDGVSGNIVTNGENVYFGCDQFNMNEKMVPGLFKETAAERPDYDTEHRDDELGNFEMKWVNPSGNATFNSVDGGIPTFFYPFQFEHKVIIEGKESRLNPFIVMKISVNDGSQNAISNFKCNAFAANMQFSKAEPGPSYEDETRQSYRYNWYIGGNKMEATYNSMVVQNEFSLRFTA